MNSADVILQAGPISNEFQCDLKHKRRTDRLKSIASSFSEKPNESFPEVFNKPKELEGFYRLLRNEAVDFNKLIAGHQEATKERATKLKRVAVLHDTTEFNWNRREATRWGVAVMSKNRQGFLAHTSLVVSADGLRCPIGCVRLRPFARPDDLQSDEERQWWDDHFPYWDSEFERWTEAVEAVEAFLGEKVEIVHIMDREGDAYELFALLDSHWWPYVIRLGQIRRVYDPITEKYCKFDEVLERSPIRTERTITISERLDAGRNNYERKTFPAREGREVLVSIRAASVKICRPASRSDLKHLDKLVPVNLVEVVELEPPEGQEAVHWILVTNEPIDTVEQVLQVVDLYRSRWVIEEYFKAIKTGCGYRKRQLDSIETLLNGLAITLPIAWRLLALRHLERHAPEAPAESLISPVQLALLQQEAPACSWSPVATLSEALYAVARLGGHIRSNGRPGWQVLGRGWTKLMTLESGYRLAMTMMEESSKGPTSPTSLIKLKPERSDQS